MNTNWKRDKAWADEFNPAIFTIMREHAATFGQILHVMPATAEKDRENGQDYVMGGGVLACRIRRPGTKQRDLTIRSTRASGHITELAKLQRGDFRWYLYCWTGLWGIEDYIIVDCQRLNDMAIFAGRREIWNYDRQSAFMAVSLRELRTCGALLYQRFAPPAKPVQQAIAFWPDPVA
jgi:hypothetical protein